MHFPIQSQSTDMWRQTAVYEILNDILRNIPGLPWTYEDQVSIIPDSRDNVFHLSVYQSFYLKILQLLARKKIDDSIDFLNHADETKFSGFFLESWGN